MRSGGRSSGVVTWEPRRPARSPHALALPPSSPSWLARVGGLVAFAALLTPAFARVGFFYFTSPRGACDAPCATALLIERVSRAAAPLNSRVPSAQ